MSQNNRLEQVMKEQKINIQKIAEITGVSTLALEFMVQKRHVPKTHVAQKIAKVLDVSMYDLWPELANKKE